MGVINLLLAIGAGTGGPAGTIGGSLKGGITLGFLGPINLGIGGPILPIVWVLAALGKPVTVIGSAFLALSSAALSSEDLALSSAALSSAVLCIPG